MKTVLVVCLLVFSVSSLLTSSHFKKEGIDIHNPLLDPVKRVKGVATSCNAVNLNVAPYNYNGTFIFI